MLFHTALFERSGLHRNQRSFSRTIFIDDDNKVLMRFFNIRTVAVYNVVAIVVLAAFNRRTLLLRFKYSYRGTAP